MVPTISEAFNSIVADMAATYSLETMKFLQKHSSHPEDWPDLEQFYDHNGNRPARIKFTPFTPIAPFK